MVIIARPWVFLIVLLLVSNAVFAAGINAEVDRRVMQEDESFYLTFSSDVEVNGAPDFSALETDFRILSRNQSSNIQIINGQMSREMKWRFMLMPKRGGQLTIPSIAFGRDKSNEVQLNVIVAKPSQNGAIKDLLYMETDVDRKSAYVQSQIIYTIRIYHALALNLINASLSDLEISDSDAIVEKLTENKPYEKIVNGKRYKVFEKKFALFAQKSGKLIIEPMIFEGQYLDRRRISHTKRLRSKKTEIDIQAIPSQHLASYPGVWLPTHQLVLREKWLEKTTKIKVGEPLTRTLTIVANGLMSSQLPEINKSLDANGIKQYVDQPSLNDDNSHEGFIARREEKIAYIPSKPGIITLPSIEVPWWNTEKNTQEFARLPSRTIEVVAVTDQNNTRASTDTPDASNAGNSSSASGSEPSLTESRIGSASSRWFWVSVVLLIVWFFTVIGWRISLRRGNLSHETGRSGHGASTENIKTIMRQLKSACRQNEPYRAKGLLIDWGRQQWPANPPMSIGHIAERVAEPLAIELSLLNHVLYSDDKNHWNGEGLWQGIQQLSAQNKQKRVHQKTVIAPLFRIVTADT
ncbi:MAG: protein BatD [Gammaproteobacteria bacterium]|nr:protein BatD [Gammaproteobacteria bacterium]